MYCGFTFSSATLSFFKHKLKAKKKNLRSAIMKVATNVLSVSASTAQTASFQMQSYLKTKHNTVPQSSSDLWHMASISKVGQVQLKPLSPVSGNEAFFRQAAKSEEQLLNSESQHRLEKWN